MAPEQLLMVRKNLNGLPELTVPHVYDIRTYQPGDEEAWAEIMNTGIGEWTADTCRERLTDDPRFLPEGLFFGTFEGKPVGSACAWRDTPDDWQVGCLHMVCVLPEHRGKGLGHALVLSVLGFLRDRGFKEVRLSTDDHRIAAIKSYLRLGFEPHCPDDSHHERWRKVMSAL